MKSSTLLLVGTWACATTGAIALLAWCVSLVWTSFFMAQFGDAIMLKAGTASYLWTSESVREQMVTELGLPAQRRWTWHSAPRNTPVLWWDSLYVTSGGRSAICVPLWPIVLAGAAGALLCHRRRRRFLLRGCCTKCGYARTGLPASLLCPECGYMNR